MLSVSPVARLPDVSGAGVTIPERKLETPLAHEYSLHARTATRGEHGRIRRLRRDTGAQVASLQHTQSRPERLSHDSVTQHCVGNVYPSRCFSVCSCAGRARHSLEVSPAGVLTVAWVSLISSRRRPPRATMLYSCNFADGICRSLQYQLAYTFSKALDDVSDVFDFAGAYALPQNSLTLRASADPLTSTRATASLTISSTTCRR